MSEKTWEQTLHEIQSVYPLMRANMPALINELFGESEESLYGIEFGNLKNVLISMHNEQYNIWENDFQNQMSFEEYMTKFSEALKEDGLVELPKLLMPQVPDNQ